MIGALSFLLSRHRSVADSLIISSGDGRHFVAMILFDLDNVNMTLSKITGVKMGDNVGTFGKISVLTVWGIKSLFPLRGL